MSKKLTSIVLALVMVLSVMTVGVVSVAAGPILDDDNPVYDEIDVALGIRFIDDMTHRQLSPHDVIDDDFIVNVSSINGNSTVEKNISCSMASESVHVSDDIIWMTITVSSGTKISLDGYLGTAEYSHIETNFSSDFNWISNSDYVVPSTRACLLTVTVSKEIVQSGGSEQSIVTLDYNTANLKVTVPTVLPVNVDSNNNVTVADNAQISNLSNGSVDVTNAEIRTDEWSVVGFDTDFTKVPVDTKQYGFKLNGDDVSDGVNTSVFNTINGNNHIGLSYDANVAIQSQPITNEDIGRIVFTVAWHK
jgi:hypothetical protein